MCEWLRYFGSVKPKRQRQTSQSTEENNFFFVRSFVSMSIDTWENNALTANSRWNVRFDIDAAVIVITCFILSSRLRPLLRLANFRFFRLFEDGFFLFSSFFFSSNDTMPRNDSCFINQLKWFFILLRVCECVRAVRKCKHRKQRVQNHYNTLPLSIYLRIYIAYFACLCSLAVSLCRKKNLTVWHLKQQSNTHSLTRPCTHWEYDEKTHIEHKWINNKCRNSNVVVDNNESTTSRKSSRFHFRAIPFYFTHIILSWRNH